MKKIVLLLILALSVAIPAQALAANNGGGAANITVTFSNDKKTAYFSSDRGLSNYTVTLCTGTLAKVELNGDNKTYTMGPYNSQIVSVTAKAGTTTKTVQSGADCKTPPPCDDDCNEIPSIPSYLALLGIGLAAGAGYTVLRRRRGNPGQA
jgi:hypothetical protein